MESTAHGQEAPRPRPAPPCPRHRPGTPVPAAPAGSMRRPPRGAPAAGAAGRPARARSVPGGGGVPAQEGAPGPRWGCHPGSLGTPGSPGTGAGRWKSGGSAGGSGDPLPRCRGARGGAEGADGPPALCLTPRPRGPGPPRVPLTHGGQRVEVLQAEGGRRGRGRRGGARGGCGRPVGGLRRALGGGVGVLRGRLHGGALRAGAPGFPRGGGGIRGARPCAPPASRPGVRRRRRSGGDNGAARGGAQGGGRARVAAAAERGAARAGGVQAGARPRGPGSRLIPRAPFGRHRRGRCGLPGGRAEAAGAGPPRGAGLSSRSPSGSAPAQAPPCTRARGGRRAGRLLGPRGAASGGGVPPTSELGSPRALRSGPGRWRRGGRGGARRRQK